MVYLPSAEGDFYLLNAEPKRRPLESVRRLGVFFSSDNKAETVEAIPAIISFIIIMGIIICSGIAGAGRSP